jgi:hypothetical protein
MFRVRLLSKLERAGKCLTCYFAPGVLLFGLLGGLLGMVPTVARATIRPRGWRSEFLPRAGPIAYDEARRQLVLLTSFAYSVTSLWE